MAPMNELSNAKLTSYRQHQTQLPIAGLRAPRVLFVFMYACAILSDYGTSHRSVLNSCLLGKCVNSHTESQNHRIVGVGRDLCGSSSPTPLTYSRLHRILSRWVLNISREGDSTTSLGSHAGFCPHFNFMGLDTLIKSLKKGFSLLLGEVLPFSEYHPHAGLLRGL